MTSGSRQGSPQSTRLTETIAVKVNIDPLCHPGKLQKGAVSALPKLRLK
jgi:hypothetical protein